MDSNPKYWSPPFVGQMRGSAPTVHMSKSWSYPCPRAPTGICPKQLLFLNTSKFLKCQFEKNLTKNTRIMMVLRGLLLGHRPCSCKPLMKTKEHSNSAWNTPSMMANKAVLFFLFRRSIVFSLDSFLRWKLACYSIYPLSAMQVGSSSLWAEQGLVFGLLK